MRTFAVAALAATLLVTVLIRPAAAGRSFVGRKLTGVKFTDTEGHTIDPSHYEGSVLVMFAGIPW